MSKEPTNNSDYVKRSSLDEMFQEQTKLIRADIQECLSKYKDVIIEAVLERVRAETKTTNTKKKS